MTNLVRIVLNIAILILLMHSGTALAQVPDDKNTLATELDSTFQLASNYRDQLDWGNYYTTLRSISAMPYHNDRAQYFIDFIESESEHLEKDNPIQAAYIWSYAARLHVINGYDEKALGFYQQAMEGLRPYEDTLYLPRIYYYLAQLVVQAKSNSIKSLEYIAEAERIYNTKVQQDSGFIGNLIFGKGWAMRGINEKEAVKCFREAQRLSGDEDGRLESFIARSLLGLGRYEEALTSAEIVISKYKQLYNELNSEGYSLAGQALSGLGRHKEAINKILKSIEIVQSGHRSSDKNQIKLFYFLAQAQNRAGKYEEALGNCQKVFTKAISAYDPKSNYDTPNLESIEADNIWVLDALELKGQILKNIYKQTGQVDALQAAVYTYQQSIHDIEKRRNLLFNWASKKQFNDYIFRSYDEALVCASLLYKDAPSLENKILLFSFLERSKATLLREKVQQEEQDERMSPKAKKKKEYLQQQIADIETKLFEKQKNKDSLGLVAIQKKLFDLRTEWEQFQKEHSAAFEQFKKPETLLDDLQSNLDGNTAVLAYHVTEENICIITITDNDLLVEIIERDGRLISHYEGMHKGLSNWEVILQSPQKSLSLFRQHADVLSELLLGPIQDLSPEVKNLLILPDGLLHGVPFGVLTLPEPDHFLFENFNVSYAYTLSMLEVEADKQRIDIRSFGGYAPSYELDENQIAGSSNEISMDQFLALRSGLLDIPAARANLIDFANRFNGVAWTEKAATKNHFMSNAGKYDLLHLGMHGQLDSASAFLSHLVFFGEKENELYLREIQAMDIPAELIVLSACNTGVGTHISGEGPLSLARAFFYAGAESTLMSLWQVPDQQTAKIMRLFYDNIDKGLSKSKALTEAKRSFLKNASNLEKHPAFWSGFVLVGNPTPLHIHTGFTYKWIAIATFLIILVLVYVYYRRKSNERNIFLEQ